MFITTEIATVRGGDPSLDHRVGLWDAIRQVSPERIPQSPLLYDARFKHWLLSQFALNVPLKLIKGELDQIRQEQVDEGEPAWPVMSIRRIADERNALVDEWVPITRRIEDGIEQTGILAKNRRLMALQHIFEKLYEEAFIERDSKNARLYLIPELRAIIHQIAEEKGELGEQGETAVDALGEIAKILAQSVAVQGSGIQDNPVAPTIEAYYREVDVDERNE